MTKKKSRGMSGYVGDVIMSGMVTGTLESSTGVGTGMTASYVNAASKPVVPVMKVKGAGMVLKSLNKIKTPKFKGVKKL